MARSRKKASSADKLNRKTTAADFAQDIAFMLSNLQISSWYDLPPEYRASLDKGAFRTKKSRQAHETTDMNRFAQVFEGNGCQFYVPDRMQTLAQKVKREFPTLGNVEVVPCKSSRLVARVGAIDLCRILMDMRDKGAKEVHVGFSGGRTPMLLAQDFAVCLKMADSLQPPLLKQMFPRVIFHSMVGSFAWNNRASDPNGYSTYFVDCPESVQELVEFHTLPAPGIALKSERESIQNIEIVKHALDVNLDIVVSSCGHSPVNSEESVEHYSFWNTLNDNCLHTGAMQNAWIETKKILIEKDVVGDFAWLPISRSEGILSPDDFPLWAFTMFSREQMLLFANSDLNDSKGNGKILMLAGPCGGPKCESKSKARILKSLFDAHPFRLSNLVLDSTTAEELVSGLD